MNKSQMALLALINVATSAVAAAVSMQFSWRQWWLPLLVIGAADALVSSTVLGVLQSKFEKGTPERSALSWPVNILFFLGVGLGIAVWKLSQ